MAKLKESYNERFKSLAQYNLTKSIAYLYKIFEELGNNKGGVRNLENKHLDEIFNASTLTKFLKFYLQNGNCLITFISCILTLDPFSNFSHDCLHNASLVENIFSKKHHKGIVHLKHFKSKYLEIQNEIKELKNKI